MTAKFSKGERVWVHIQFDNQSQFQWTIATVEQVSASAISVYVPSKSDFVWVQLGDVLPASNPSQEGSLTFFFGVVYRWIYEMEEVFFLSPFFNLEKSWKRFDDLNVNSNWTDVSDLSLLKFPNMPEILANLQARFNSGIYNSQITELWTFQLIQHFICSYILKECQRTFSTPPLPTHGLTNSAIVPERFF